MGNWFSRPPVLKKEPWMKGTPGWGKEVRDELRAKVVAYRPKNSLQISSFNIVLVGQIGSGKSSLINSINSVIEDDMYCKAGVGKMASSLTKEFCRYPMSPALQLYDTMGVHPDTKSDVYINNILKAVEGHVPDGYMFIPGEKFQSDNPDYIANPKLADRAHCVAIVVNAENVYVMGDEMKEKLKNLSEGLIERKIPLFIILTHLDEFCKEVQKDITKMYHSIAVEELVTKISKMVHGLQENHIFPVINYRRNFELDDNMDVLVLHALRQMLRACRDHLEILEKQYGETPAMLETPEATLKYGQQEVGVMPEELT